MAIASCALPGPEGPGAQSDDLASAVTVSFQDGVGPTAAYAGTHDTYLADATPTTGFGAVSTLIVDGDYPDGTGHHALALVRWDLSSIPAGSTVQSATVSLDVSNPTSGPYGLYPLLHDWNESQATWNLAATGTAWSAPGARGAGDRAAELGTIEPTATGTSTTPLAAAGIARIQSWVDRPATNFGLALDSTVNVDGLRFASREDATPANRPRLTVTYTPPATTGGLRGQYYSDQTLSTLALTRTDATVGFDWGAGSPAGAIAVDHFSVRWTGSIAPRYTETYTFTTTSDDGVRLWINGVELVNNWTDHGATGNSGTIALTAGTHYDLRLEYYENAGSAVAKLAWSSAHQAAEIVPQSQLAPPSTGTDAGVDASRPDTGTDASRTDAGVDASRPDTGTDAARPDAGSCHPYVDQHASERAVCTFTTGAHANATLGDFTAARAALQHVIIVVHENRSMDHYFGHTGHGIEGIPAGYTNPDSSGRAVAPFHYTSNCACDINHSTGATQAEWDHGAMDGFARTDGLGSMGYYTDADHPFYTWLLTTFATSDRYFCAALSDTGHNRHYLWAGAATTGPFIFDQLTAAGVNWTDYYEGAGPLYGATSNANAWPGHLRHDPTLSTFYAALRDPTGASLPALSVVDQEATEHPTGNLHSGENATRTLVENVLASPSWAHTALIFTYDEGGGFLDHVDPPHACLGSTAASEAGFDNLGIRVPFALVSPYAIGGYVSHVTHSHSSITRFIEAMYGLNALTPRDANSDALMDMFDFGCPHFATPPPASSVPAAGSLAACGPCASGP